MKRIKVLYWIFTGLFAAFMLFTSIPDIMNTSDAIAFMNGHLQYPLYIIPFIGWAKALGVIAILIPGFPRIKEWAYAGLMFDLIGALYSIIAVDGISLSISFMFLAIAFEVCSYILYHKKLSHAQHNN